MNAHTAKCSSSPDPAVAQAAAGWLARRDGGLSEREKAEFHDWLSSDPRHGEAWQELQASWQAFDEARHAGLARDMVFELARRRRRRRLTATLSIAASVTAVAAAIVVVLVRPSPTTGLVSRVEVRTMDDGSTVELGRGAKIEIQYEPGRRVVHLARGVALFSVAKNPGRPFIVSTGHVDVRATGTAFAVQADHDAVDVIVTEGEVSVGRSPASPPLSGGEPPRGATEPVLVGAGDRLVISVAAPSSEPLHVETLSTEELAQRLAWREPRIELSGTRLVDAAALFNRENRVQLRIGDKPLAELRLSGKFRADDAEGFVRLLEANYEVMTERAGDRIELRYK